MLKVLIQSMGSDDVKAAAVSLAACAIIPVMMKIRSHRKKVAKSHNAAAGTHDDEKKDA